MSCNYTLIDDMKFNERQQASPLEEKQSQFWEFQWKHSFDWNELSCGKIACCLLGVFNGKFGIGSTALDELPHFEIPALRITLGSWEALGFKQMQSGSCATLAEIYVAARSFSSVRLRFFWSMAWRSNSCKYRKIFLIAIPVRRK